MTAKFFNRRFSEVTQLTQLGFLRAHSGIRFFHALLQGVVEPFQLYFIEILAVLLNRLSGLVMLLERQVVLEELMLISFVVDSSHQVLEAANIDLVVKNTLQILKVNFFCQNCI